MENNVIKFVSGQLTKIENAISLTNKLLVSKNNQHPQINKIIRFHYHNGEALGFVHEGKIHLNGEHLNPNTLIYLAGHIFIEWVKYNNATLYSKAMELIQNSRYLLTLKQSEFYKLQATKAGFYEGTIEYEDYFKQESLASEIGDRGAQFIMETRRKNINDWNETLSDTIDKEPGLQNFTLEELKGMNLKELCKRISANILKGDKSILNFEFA